MRILVVDDDQRLTQLLQLILESRGVGVTVAHNGQQALEYLERESPDVILLDLVMPGMSGLEVGRQIQTNPETSNIPIIVFTAKSGEEAQKEAAEVGAIEHLTKPIRPSELIKHIRKVFDDSDTSLTGFLT